MIPMDELEGRLDAQAHRVLVQSAKDSRFNIFRFWGGGMFLPDAWSVNSFVALVACVAGLNMVARCGVGRMPLYMHLQLRGHGAAGDCRCKVYDASCLEGKACLFEC